MFTHIVFIGTLCDYFMSRTLRLSWTLNRINYYYKTLYTNLHYFIVSVGLSRVSFHLVPVLPLFGISCSYFLLLVNYRLVLPPVFN